MKNLIKLLGIIAIVAIIGFSMAACDDGGGGGGASEPFEVTADANGEIIFSHDGGESPIIPATVTTDLPAPNDSFTLTTFLEKKPISGLTANQKVTGKVSCSGNSIRADVYGNTVGIQTYKN